MKNNVMPPKAAIPKVGSIQLKIEAEQLKKMKKKKEKVTFDEVSDASEEEESRKL